MLFIVFCIIFDERAATKMIDFFIDGREKARDCSVTLSYFENCDGQIAHDWLTISKPEYDNYYCINVIYTVHLMFQ